ncbi:hypothetical protein I4U23_022293 [Adineta vaga]|nr:hypothetical protein I4U23_022293 [Adineta vaga]
MNEFYTNSQTYEGVHLLLLDYSEKGYWKLHYSNNNETDESNVILQSLVSGTFVLSNNLFARPFQKVIFGNKMFSDILEHHNNILNKHSDTVINKQHVDSLVNDIMYTILQNRTTLYRNGRDQNLDDRFLATEQWQLDEVSAIDANYTNLWVNALTRTNTVILVFQNGSTMYIERTLKFDERNNSYWLFTNNTFVIESIKGNNICSQKTSQSSKLIWVYEHRIIWIFFYVIVTLSAIST